MICRSAPKIINDQSCVVQLAYYPQVHVASVNGTRHCVGQHPYAIGLHHLCWGRHASNPALPPTPPPFLPRLFVYTH